MTLSEEQWSEEIGRRIYIARKNKGFSMAQLGQIVGLSESAVKKYESGGIKSPKLSILDKISVALEIENWKLYCLDLRDDKFEDRIRYVEEEDVLQIYDKLTYEQKDIIRNLMNSMIKE